MAKQAEADYRLTLLYLENSEQAMTESHAVEAMALGLGQTELVQLAYAFCEKNRPLAIKLFEMAKREKNLDRDALLKLGQLYLEEKKSELARQTFDQVLTLEENHLYAIIGMADAYILDQNWPKAADFLSWAVNQTPFAWAKLQV